MEITGLVTAVFPEQSGTSAEGKEWKRMDFLLGTDEKYPSEIFFSMFNQRIVPLEIGYKVSVKFNITSRKVNDKYYTSCNVYNITILSGTSTNTLQG